MRDRDTFANIPGRRTFRCDGCSKRLAEIWPNDYNVTRWYVDNNVTRWDTVFDVSRWDGIIYVPDHVTSCACDRKPMFYPRKNCLSVICPRCRVRYHYKDVMGELYPRLAVSGPPKGRY